MECGYSRLEGKLMCRMTTWAVTGGRLGWYDNLEIWRDQRVMSGVVIQLEF